MAAQDMLRIATWNAELSRTGPGVLLRDILSGEDAEVLVAVDHILKTTPDVLVLTGIDTDFEGHTARALAVALTQAGAAYPYVFSDISNAGLFTGRDLDKDGRLGQAKDAQSYGDFHGQGGLAVLSRLPIAADDIIDFSTLLWRDVPDARLPDNFYDAGDLGVLRLSSTNHWDVPVMWDETPIHLLAFYATTPAFDGDEDRNGLRNADEVALWRHYLDGGLDTPAPDMPFVVIGDANLDPQDGAGRIEEMQALLADPRLQDPQPRSRYAKSIANEAHTGDAALDTADWDDPVPGNLRVDYVLPSADLKVLDAGGSWSSASNRDGVLFRHGLVWVDIARQ
ncbi:MULTISPECIES: endonuclease/exonuclease/phosphatase family protein [Pacificibacter]|uniref:endonuclease/exonuclease/phosphatase family protein n=1 Tax=Pacificibacter TaxID=1042323 RepID=UPI001C08D2B3|nr:endonuclease/exonuclease/phosphatase family protein [Pacificibacter sp. 1_MG-2023]MBU2937241.1 endonuclease/exonuclease/phosphatase family protein [Pacificibacter marinus]MDO6615236.1 endonuclease/exonuclease/phosphatase family protein [Pacificibacter sp. 1_MG-2023]